MKSNLIFDLFQEWIALKLFCYIVDTETRFDKIVSCFSDPIKFADLIISLGVLIVYQVLQLQVG